jgi:hypothetical protein
MTVVTFAECGTDLPVPEAFDRCSQSSADVTVDSLEVPAEASESEGLYDGALPGNLVGADDEDLTGFAERTDLEAKDDALVQETLVDGKTKDPCNTHSPPLTFQDSRVLDSMVNQAMLSASIEDGLTLPWETGVMTAIFGDEPLVTLPKPVKLTHSLQTDQPLGPRNQDAGTGQASKRLRTAEASQRRFERAIVFKNSLTDRELDDAKWNRALEKLYAIMVSCPAGTPQGVKFDTKDIELNLRQIKILCGARSPNTVAKRANSLAQYCIWHKGYCTSTRSTQFLSVQTTFLTTFGKSTKMAWPTGPFQVSLRQ